MMSINSAGLWRKFLPVLTLPIVLSAMSCSPMKRMETRTEQLHSNSQKRFFAEQTAVHDSLAFRRLYEALSCELAAERMRERERTENVEIVMRVYDTSRPADTLTGKPPLMCETTERRIAADSDMQPGLRSN